MKHIQEIQIAFRDRKYCGFERKFKLTATKGWRLKLQKLLVWAALKLKAFEDESIYESVKTHTIVRDDIVKWINLHQHEIIKSYGSEPEYILIGPEELYKLEQELIIHLDNFFVRSFPNKEGYDLPYRYEYRGLKILLVPWMKGIVALPNFKMTKEIRF